MKIRRPDPEKAAKQLERQHIAAADRAAQVVRARRAPVGFQAPPSVTRMADAVATALRTEVS